MKSLPGVLFSSALDDEDPKAKAETPLSVFLPVWEEFHPTLDAAASDDNAKVRPHRPECDWTHVRPGQYCDNCRRFIGTFFTIEDDALAQDWGKQVVWCNAPYSRRVGRWVAKFAEAARAGATVVALLPHRSSTDWWHNHIWDRELHRERDRVQVRELPGRIRFVGFPDEAPFPSVIVVFHPPLGKLKRALWR